MPDRVFGALLMLPIVVWVVGVIAYPLGSAISLSFRNEYVIGSPSSFVGLANYKALFTDGVVLPALKTSAIWTLSNAVLQTAMGLAAALVLHHWLRRQRWAQSFIFLPWVVPTVVAALIWKWLLSASYGVLSQLLLRWHVIDQPLDLLGNPRTSMATVVFINSWRWFPFFTVVLLSAMQNVPSEEYEAASMEGAGGVRQFRDITMPHVARTLKVMAVVGTILSFSVFDVIYLITRGGPLTSTTTLPVLVYKQAFEQYNISAAATTGVFMFLLVLGFAAVILVGIRMPRRVRGR